MTETNTYKKTHTKTKTHTHTQTKTNTKCFQDPMYAIFFKSRGFKDLRYYIDCLLLMTKTNTWWTWTWWTWTWCSVPFLRGHRSSLSLNILLSPNILLSSFTLSSDGFKGNLRVLTLCRFWQMREDLIPAGSLMLSLIRSFQRGLFNRGWRRR